MRGGIATHKNAKLFTNNITAVTVYAQRISLPGHNGKSSTFTFKDVLITDIDG